MPTYEQELANYELAQRVVSEGKEMYWQKSYLMPYIKDIWASGGEGYTAFRENLYKQQQQQIQPQQQIKIQEQPTQSKLPPSLQPGGLLNQVNAFTGRTNTNNPWVSANNVVGINQYKSSISASNLAASKSYNLTPTTAQQPTLTTSSLSNLPGTSTQKNITLTPSQNNKTQSYISAYSPYQYNKPLFSLGNWTGMSATQYMKKGSISPKEQPFYTYGEVQQKYEFQGMGVINPNIDIKDLGMSVVKSTPPVAFGEALKEAQKNPAYYWQDLSTQFADTTAYKMNVGIGLAGLIPVAAEFAGMDKQIFSAQLEGMKEKPFKFQELRIGEGNAVSVLKATRTERGITQELTLTGKIYQEDTGKFIMPEAKGKLITSGQFGWTSAKFTKGTNILAETEFSLGAKGTAINLGKFGKENLALSIAKVNMIPKTSGTFLFETGTRYSGGIDNAFLGMTKAVKPISKPIIKDIGFGISNRIEQDLYAGMGGKLRNVDLTISPKKSIKFTGTFDAYGLTKTISKESFIGQTGGVYDFGATKTISGGKSLLTGQKHAFISGVTGGINFKNLLPALTKTTYKTYGISGITTSQLNMPKTKTTTTEKISQISKSRMMQVLIPSTKSLTKNELANAPILNFATGGIQTTRFKFAQAPVLNQQPIQTTKQTTKQLYAIPNVPIVPNVPFNLIPNIPVPPYVPPVFPTFEFPRLFDYERKGKAKPIKFRGKYAPNVAAIGLGIKSLKIPKSYKQGFGALALRPEIIFKKLKRRK
jgi:hypothetical protein